MNFELAEEHRLLQDLVARFVRENLMPLENKVLERDALDFQAICLLMTIAASESDWPLIVVKNLLKKCHLNDILG